VVNLRTTSCNAKISALYPHNVFNWHDFRLPPRSIGILDFLTLKMEPICCPETSIRNYYYTLRNIAEEWIFLCIYWFHMIATININFFPIQLQEHDLFVETDFVSITS